MKGAPVVVGPVVILFIRRIVQLWYARIGNAEGQSILLAVDFLLIIFLPLRSRLPRINTAVQKKLSKSFSNNSVPKLRKSKRRLIITRLETCWSVTTSPRPPLPLPLLLLALLLQVLGGAMHKDKGSSRV